MDDGEDLVKQLNAFLDNELSETEAAEVKKKIIHSDQWRTEYEKLQALDRLLQQWDRREIQGISASSAFQQKLIERIRTLKKSSALAKSFLSLPQSVFSSKQL